MLVARLACIVALVAAVTSCRTTVRAYPVKSGTERKGGIPFFLPRAYVNVKAPIETERAEALFAVLELGGVHRFLLELNMQDMDSSIQQVRQLLALDSKAVMRIIPAETALTVRTESSEKNTEDVSQGRASGEEKPRRPAGGDEIPKEDGGTARARESATGTRRATTSEQTAKYSLVPQPSFSDDVVPVYSGAPEKAIEVIMIPDFEREYELVVSPSIFASVSFDVKLSDGWRLESINSETGENQLIKEASSLAQALLGGRKEERLAEIGRKQAIELARLAQQTSTPAASASAVPQAERPDTPIDVELRLVGYAKRVTIGVIPPGVYDLHAIAAKGRFSTRSSTYWKRMPL